MHLQRSHNLTTAEYETKFCEVETAAGNDAGYRQHFLISDTGGNLVSAQSPVAAVTTPSKSRRNVSRVSDSARLVRGNILYFCIK